MGLARAAELRVIPALDTFLDAIEEGKLPASRDQRERIQQVFNTMHGDAVRVGRRPGLCAGPASGARPAYRHPDSVENTGVPVAACRAPAPDRRGGGGTRPRGKPPPSPRR